MKKFTINVPDGHTVDTSQINSGVITITPELPKSPIEAFKVFEDILAFHGHTWETFDAWCEDLAPHERGRRKEELIVAAYNGRQLNDPLPDWTDETPKRYPIFKMPSPSGAGFSFRAHADVRWDAYSGVGSRQVFFGENSLDHLRDAVSKFLLEYQESRTL